MTASITQILPDFFFVERGWLNANHFVSLSNDNVLIDTGYAGGISETLQIFKNLGINLRTVDRIITTHTHCDHIGAHSYIQQLSGCQIILSRIDKYFIDTRNDWFTWWRYYDQEAEFFKASSAVGEHDLITIGEIVFEVFHTPGHASGGIVLFDRDRSLLISSDALWSHDIGVLTPRIEGNMCVFQALDSLTKIERLEPRIAYPGHGPVIKDVPAAIERCRRRLFGYIEKPQAQGLDQIKKIIVYFLLMKGGFPKKDLFTYLMTTQWFPETVELFFNGRQEWAYREALNALIERGAVRVMEDLIKPNVNP